MSSSPVKVRLTLDVGAFMRGLDQARSQSFSYALDLTKNRRARRRLLAAMKNVNSNPAQTAMHSAYRRRQQARRRRSRR